MKKVPEPADTDSLYPNDGLVAGVYDSPPDEEQENLARDEIAYVQANLPIIEDVISWFNDQIERSESISNVDLKSNLPAEVQVLAFQKVGELLLLKRQEFERLFDAYKYEEKQRAKEANDEAA